MTLKELYIKLKKSGISEDHYYLHGLYGSTNDDNKLALTIKKRKYSTEYEVYYKERGEKYSERIFKTEDDACQYIFKELMEDKEIEEKFSK